MTACTEPNLQEGLAVWLDGGLGAEEAARTALHVRACEACREEASELAVLAAFLRQTGPRRASAEEAGRGGCLPADALVDLAERGATPQTEHQTHLHTCSSCAELWALLQEGGTIEPPEEATQGSPQEALPEIPPMSSRLRGAIADLRKGQAARSDSAFATALVSAALTSSAPASTTSSASALVGVESSPSFQTSPTSPGRAPQARRVSPHWRQALALAASLGLVISLATYTLNHPPESPSRTSREASDLPVVAPTHPSGAFETEQTAAVPGGGGPVSKRVPAVPKGGIKSPSPAVHEGVREADRASHPRPTPVESSPASADGDAGEAREPEHQDGAPKVEVALGGLPASRQTNSPDKKAASSHVEAGRSGQAAKSVPVASDSGLERAAPSPPSVSAQPTLGDNRFGGGASRTTFEARDEVASTPGKGAVKTLAVAPPPPPQTRLDGGPHLAEAPKAGRELAEKARLARSSQEVDRARQPALASEQGVVALEPPAPRAVRAAAPSAPSVAPAQALSRGEVAATTPAKEQLQGLGSGPVAPETVAPGTSTLGSSSARVAGLGRAKTPGLSARVPRPEDLSRKNQLARRVVRQLADQPGATASVGFDTDHYVVTVYLDEALEPAAQSQVRAALLQTLGLQAGRGDRVVFAAP